MPFTKSNWTCSPPLEEDGFFPYSQAFTLRDITLDKGTQTRPCFLHVSSEVECLIPSLTIIASVDTLDLYALVGPMDCFDYRHISRMQGTPMDVVSETGDQTFYFKVDTSAVPKEGVWQVQLKLSATGQNVATIRVAEMVVTLNRAAGTQASRGTSFVPRTTPRTAAPTTTSASSSTSTTPARSNVLTLRTSTASASTPRDELQLSRSRAASSGQLGTSTSLSQRGGGAGGPGVEQQALVASVLNAVCEKMVGVVSDKTKGYLAKASRRTERKVLDKMQRLEERIQNFDRVLDNATTSMTGLEKSLGSLDVSPPPVVS